MAWSRKVRDIVFCGTALGDFVPLVADGVEATSDRADMDVQARRELPDESCKASRLRHFFGARPPAAAAAVLEPGLDISAAGF